MPILLTDKEIPYQPDNVNNEYYGDIGARDRAIYLEGAKAQLKKVVEWEEEFCVDHWARRADGTMKSRTPRRRFCGHCRQALLKEVE